MRTWVSFPTSRPRTISLAVTRVVSSRPRAPRSFSPASEPASTAGPITRAIVTSIPSHVVSTKRKTSKG